MLEGRRDTRFGRLLRHGFSDAVAAEALLGGEQLAPVRSDPVLLDALGATADPDQALASLVRLLEALDPGERRTLLDTLTTAKPLRDRLLGVLGASVALADHLTRHPRDWHALVTYEHADLHPGTTEFERGLAGADDPESLRVAYRRCMLGIAARDVCGTSDLVQTAAELADLATATLRAALAMAEEEAPGDAALCRLAVIGMGKCGGHELNYISDVDVIFVAEARPDAEEAKALQAATRLASRMMRICSDTTVEGSIWQVDANLRPEGRRGPLVRTSPATWPTTSAGPRRGSSRRCSRPARWPATRRSGRSTSRRCRPWCGRPPNASTSSRTCRRCGAGSWRTSPSRTWTGS